MCGRYTANTEDEVIEIRSILAGLTMRLAGDLLFGEYREKVIFPSDIATIITSEGRLTSSRFGFDKWDGKGLIINARSETAAASRFFSPFVKGGRCIVPASNYFEWKKASGLPSVKYRLRTGAKHGLFMAGLHKPLPSGEVKDSFIIMTKPADSVINDIHDRMPVIIDIDMLMPWLKGKITPEELSCESAGKVFFEKAV